MTDPITEALDAFAPAFDAVEGDWQAILLTASRPASITPVDQAPVARRRPWRRTTSVRRTIALAFAVLAVLALGTAWAAGAWTPTSPLTLFGTHSPADTGSGPIFAGDVIPGSVKQVASVDIPKVGPVALWHAETKQGGWCLGLRLTDGSWLGLWPKDGGSPLSNGGSVPGCFPTGVIDGGNHHLEWLENDIDATSVGGTFWRIRTGVITVPGAVKVTDLTTGQSTDVVDGNVFMLVIQAPNPHTPGDNSPTLHLVAYDNAGNVIASDGIDSSGG